VPLRGIFESLGAQVEYNAATRAIQATSGATTVQLSIGSRDASVNGKIATLEVPASTIGGRTLVPLRFVSEALGAQVKWQAATHTVEIVSGAPAAPPAPERAPQVSDVTVDAQGALGPGDVIHVRAYGEPHCQAYFEIRGQVQRVEMSDEGEGAYVGSWTVPKGYNFQEAPVFVHLLGRGGREAVGEARTRVSVGAPQDTPGVNVSPAPGQMAQGLRPVVRVDFPMDIRLDSVRLSVDRNDFSNQALRNGRHVEWNAGYDLAPGRH
ncbi:unnamed protein product, partial [Phaeothamnion confervicola]